MLTPNRSEIAQCWSLLPHPPGTVTRVFARDRETGELDGDFARNAGEMYHFASVHTSKQVYVCPNPAREGTAGVRHKASDVTHWSYLLLDMDPIEEVVDPHAAMEEALTMLGEWVGTDFGRRPPLILSSGRGVQAWIRLQDVLLDDCDTGVPEDDFYRYNGDVISCRRRMARKVNGFWLGMLSERLGMCHGCKIDTSTSDLPRPMRMPGTYNQKTGRMAAIAVGSGTVYDGLAVKLHTGVPKARLIEPDVTPLAPGMPWQKSLHLLTLTARKYLKEGQEEPGRHKVAFHTARKLHELGVSRDEARKALRHANKLQGRAQELSQEEIEHALDTAGQG